KINNKSYIGLTIQGSRTRYLHHQYEVRSGSNFPIHNAIRKHGLNNFELTEIINLEELNYSPELLKDLEKHYIRLYNSNNRSICYNITEGGDGTLGRKHSNETKRKIRLKALGRKATEETKKALKDSYDRRRNTPEWDEWYSKMLNRPAHNRIKTL